MNRRHAQEGFGLVLVVLIAGGLALILATTLPTTLNELALTHTRAAQVRAYHLAEGGIDATLNLLQLNTSVDDLKDKGWKEDDSGAFLLRDFAASEFGWSFPPPTTVVARVMMDHPEVSTQVRIWSYATITHPGSPQKPQTSLLSVTLQSIPTFPYRGLTVGGEYKVSGNSLVDSYDSSIFPYTYTYGVNSSENFTLSTTQSAKDSIKVSGLEIKGDMNVGTAAGVDPASAIWRSHTLSLTGTLAGGFEGGFVEIVPPDVTGPEVLTSF